MNWSKQLCLLLWMLPVWTLAQQPGDLDIGFGANGARTISIGVYGPAIRGNVATDLGGGNEVYIAFFAGSQLLVGAYDSNGQPLSTFGNGGLALISPAAGLDRIARMKVLADRSLLLAGTSKNVNPGAGDDIFVMKLDANGVPDPNFGVGGEVEFSTTAEEGATDLGVLPNGNIYVLGNQTPGRYNYPESILLRYLPNGTLDTTFGLGGWAYPGFSGSTERGFCMGMQPNGRVIVGGVRNQWTEPLWYSKSYIVYPNGSNSSFSTYSPYFGSAYGSYEGIEMTDEGGMCFGGTVTGNGKVPHFYFHRLDSVGDADSSFGQDGVALLLGEEDSVPQFAGMTMVGERAVIGLANWEMNDSVIHTSLYKLDSTGNADASFGGNYMGQSGLSWHASGSIPHDKGLHFESLQQQSTGGLIAVGHSEDRVVIVRFHHPGALEIEPGQQDGLRFNLSPNPVAVGEVLTVEIDDRQGAIAYTLLDAQGKTLAEWPAEKRNAIHELRLPEGLAKGLYFLRARQNTAVVSRKLLLKSE